MPPVLSSLAIATLVGVSAACSYDWTTALVTDGGNDASAVDATTTGDASAVDAMVSDAPGADTASTCTMLLANVVAARAAAKTCSLPVNASTCTMTVTDECSCTQIINQSKAPYVSAIAAYKAASCTNSPCPSCGTMQQGLCVASDASATGLACTQ